MKKVYLFICIMLVSIPGHAQGLVASYPFNGNANDATGTANGAVNGATLTTDRFGDANSAYYFDGVNNYIEAVADALPTGDNTISLWFNADVGSIVNQPGLLGYGGNAGPCPGNSQILIINLSGSGKYTTQAHCLNNYADYTYASLPENNWYNWVVTRSGTTIKMFINGVLVSTANTATQPVIVSGKKLSIGAVVSPAGVANYTDANVGHFKGKLDDIKIYNAALSSAQIFDTYVNDLKKPGSGNTIQLTGTGSLTTSPYINIGSGYDFGSQPFTYETWVKRDMVTTTLNNYGKTLIAGDNNGSWGVGLLNDNTLFFTKVGINYVASTTIIADTKWHHVAVVYTGTQIQFYIDGVAAGNPGYTDNFSNSSGNYFIGPRQSFGNSNGDGTLDGQLDETRIWRNVALTQTEIRDWMCKKINSSHPEYTNLQSYFRLDEGNGTITGGYGSKFGTLINTPAWQTSGASLGDASAYDYTNPTKAASISHPDGENFTVTSTSGSPAGIQVYRVDTIPNSTVGANSGSNNKYFGVFQAGGTSPQYTAVYNYNGNPLVNAGNEASLRLAKRTDNSVAIWAQLPNLPNQPAKTITVTGESTEYILGAAFFPLPVTLISFTAQKQSSSVKLNWETENEIDFSKFAVERSTDNQSWTIFAEVSALNRAGRNSYTTADENPVIGMNLYRLKEMGISGDYKYSNIVRADFSKITSISISPNPAKDYIIVTGAVAYKQIQLFDAAGKIVKQINKESNNRYSITGLNKGIYFIRFIGGEDMPMQKIIIE